MSWKRLIVSGCFVLLITEAAWSGNGHLLHGVGPWNSSMGGAGVALLQDSLAALHMNPALLTKVKGHQISLSSEFFVDGLRVEARVGNVSGGSTDATRQLGVIPSFAWMGHQDGKPIATGFGLLGVAGFRTDYPQDSSNFLLVPQPEGFGRIYTDLAITKIPLAFGFQINPKFSLGASLNVYRGVLAIQPLPVVQPDFDAEGLGWLPGASNQVARFGLGVQFGFYYEPTPMVSLGASYTSKQKFQEYEWNSTNVNPNVPEYGSHRRLEFQLDGPQTLQFGVGLHPTPKLSLAADAKWVKYEGVAGIGEEGGVDVVNHKLIGIGWQNIWIALFGAEYKPTEKIAIRGGYNHGQSPIRPEFTVTSMGTPSTFQKHFCGGLGMAIMPNVSFDFGFYVVPRETKTGPILSLYQGEIPNSEIRMSNKITSALVALNFSF
jgi:long-chain fatty acid transport protein